ncbi:MAG TPA: methyltransferase domain-containing protein [Steroidobacteraceae bacterium]|nr:methyltransferase domain-containing protein [Steroidobacteraceae bacterium]
MSPPESPSHGLPYPALDRAAVARNFARAAAGFDIAAAPLGEVREELLSRIGFFGITPGVVLDLGAGTGQAARALRRRFRRAFVIALDASPAMLSVAARRARWPRRFERIAGDACALPLRDGSCDLVIANLSLPWFVILDLALTEVRRVLAPRGLFLFSTLGPATLRELRESWAAADRAPHVHDFADMHDLGSALARAGFIEPVLDVEQFTRRFHTLHEIATALRATGTQNAHAARARGLTGRGRFAVAQEAYERQRLEGLLPATFEVVYGAAFACEPGGERANRL